MSARRTTCSGGRRRRRWTTASRRWSRGSRSGARGIRKRTGRSNVRRARMSLRMASKSPRAPKQLVGLFGPTASGKTAVAGILRERLGAEVISADSAALYAGLPVITAAPDYPARLVVVVPLVDHLSAVK